MTKTIIVGGGAIGLSLAWELSRRQHAVTLIDRDQVGRATSWAAAGILPPANLTTATDPIDQLRGLSHQLFPDWANQLEPLTGIDLGFARCGGWYLANTPGEAAAMVGMADYWHELEIECQTVTLSNVAEREPKLSPWIQANPNASAWWVPDEYQIRSPRYLQALAAACRQAGVQIIEHVSVNDIAEHNGMAKVMGISNDDSVELQGDAVVVASGAWTGTVAPSLRLEQSIVPVRGQILQFKADTCPLKGIVNIGHRYLIARDDGTVIVGSCEEEVGLQLGTTDTMLSALREFALDLCPSLADATEERAWSGLRPMTFDGFPMIGRVPDSDCTYVAAGHFRSGLHLSPGTAVVLADLIDGLTPSIDVEPFRVGKQQTNP